MNATVKNVMTTEVVAVRRDTTFPGVAAGLLHHKDVRNILLHEFLIDPRQFRVTVEAGVVTLEGIPETAALGRTLVRKARHVPGVVAVHDLLSYPDVYPVVAGPVF